jgi:hypothetical protein
MLNIACCRHVCNCRPTNSIPYTQYGSIITVCLRTLIMSDITSTYRAGAMSATADLPTAFRTHNMPV